MRLGERNLIYMDLLVVNGRQLLGRGRGSSPFSVVKQLLAKDPFHLRPRTAAAKIVVGAIDDMNAQTFAQAAER